ncbi:MAG TPA: cob(I)yrinic acid a,c-diamide adenosyltransferase [Tepidisphaeraceae bacterium]|nr:cob(I)yrinic acid a,c-diamide adenosyltransferase [Tepidisphaeraceae bacterium]
MKIYTKTGDDGTTGLVGGTRVAKSDPRIECYGTVDELNAAIGLAAVAAQPPLVGQLRQVQADLFTIGSHLATPQDSPQRKSLPQLDDSIITRLEHQIDATTAQLPPLRNFILPGGSELAARLHLARTICRRAERLVVALPSEPAVAFTVCYLNRLSDWLFTEARRANDLARIPDVIWTAS